MNNITKISVFKNGHDTTPVKDILLYNFYYSIINGDYKAEIQKIRSCTDKEEKKRLKKELPCVTVSGTFSKRNSESLIKHSMRICIDLDGEKNPHIYNWSELRDTLGTWKEVEFSSLSASGKGVFIVIVLAYPEKHLQHYLAIESTFKNRFGIITDPLCKDIPRLRFMSYDKEAILNENAIPYRILYQEPQPKKYNRPTFSDTWDKIKTIITKIKENKIDITEGYDNWLKIGSALENEFGESGRGYFHAVSQYHAKYSISDTDRMFDNVLKHNNGKVKIGSFFHIAGDYGIKIQHKPAEVNQEPAPRIIKKENSQITTLPKVEKIIPVKHGIWDEQIEELERFFQIVKLPDEPINLNAWTKITDVSMFVNTHLSIVKFQNGNKRYITYLDRLNELKTILSLN